MCFSVHLTSVGALFYFWGIKMSIFKEYPILIFVGIIFLLSFCVFAFRFKSEIIYFIRCLIKKFRKKYKQKGVWRDKKWLVIGDSLSDVTTTYTNMQYCDYISLETGIKVKNKARRGTGYAKRLKLKNSFYLKTLKIPQKVDLITIFGSFNDFTVALPLGSADDVGFNSIAGYINESLTNILRSKSTAKLVVFTPTPWSEYNPVCAKWETQVIANGYVDLLKEICNRRDILCLDLYYDSPLRPWESEFREKYYSKDANKTGGVHPNEEGQLLIAKVILNFLQNIL